MGDITVRDGFQHLEKFISTRAKIFYAEEMIFAGCRNIEVTNLGNPYLMPQFSDAEDILGHLRSERFRKKCEKRGIDYNDICITAVTIREKAVDRAIELSRAGDRTGPLPDDGVHRRRASFRQLRHDPAGLLEGGRALHSEMPGCRASRCAARSAPSGAARSPEPPI